MRITKCWSGTRLTEPPLGSPYNDMDQIKAFHQLKERLEGTFPGHNFFDKKILDCLKKEGLLNHGWNDRNIDEQKTINASAFIQAVLPFSIPTFKETEATLSKVDPQRIFGGHYKQYKPISTTKAVNLMGLLDNQSTKKSHEAAHYIKIGNTGIYVASEGKNRIELYKKNNRLIKALVSETYYPEAGELEMHKIKPHNSFCIEYIGSNKDTKNSLQAWQTVNIKSTYYAGLPYMESIDFFKEYGVVFGKNLYSFKGWVTNRKIKVYLNHRFYIN